MPSAKRARGFGSAESATSRHAARTGTLQADGTLVFDSGKVDFSPERKLTPGDAPNAFPPKAAQPGSVGDQNYSPLVHIQNAGDTIYNAPMIAYNVPASQIEFPNGNPDYRLVHDKVVSISPKAGTVTLRLTTGFSFATAQGATGHTARFTHSTSASTGAGVGLTIELPLYGPVAFRAHESRWYFTGAPLEGDRSRSLLGAGLSWRVGE